MGKPLRVHVINITLEDAAPSMEPYLEPGESEKDEDDGFGFKLSEDPFEAQTSAENERTAFVVENDTSENNEDSDGECETEELQGFNGQVPTHADPEAETADAFEGVFSNSFSGNAIVEDPDCDEEGSKNASSEASSKLNEESDSASEAASNLSEASDKSASAASASCSGDEPEHSKSSGESGSDHQEPSDSAEASNSNLSHEASENEESNSHEASGSEEASNSEADDSQAHEASDSEESHSRDASGAEEASSSEAASVSHEASESEEASKESEVASGGESNDEASNDSFVVMEMTDMISVVTERSAITNRSKRSGGDAEQDHGALDSLSSEEPVEELTTEDLFTGVMFNTASYTEDSTQEEAVGNSDTKNETNDSVHQEDDVEGMDMTANEDRSSAGTDSEDASVIDTAATSGDESSSDANISKEEASPCESPTSTKKKKEGRLARIGRALKQKAASQSNGGKEEISTAEGITEDQRGRTVQDTDEIAAYDVEELIDETSHAGNFEGSITNIETYGNESMSLNGSGIHSVVLNTSDNYDGHYSKEDMFYAHDQSENTDSAHGNGFYDGRNNEMHSDSNKYGDRSVANVDERSILDVIDEDEGSSEEDEKQARKESRPMALSLKSWKACRDIGQQETVATCSSCTRRLKRKQA